MATTLATRPGQALNAKVYASASLTSYTVNVQYARSSTFRNIALAKTPVVNDREITLSLTGSEVDNLQDCYFRVRATKDGRTTVVADGRLQYAEPVVSGDTGGAVDSVNGQTGVVVLNASHVGAVSSVNGKTGSSVTLTSSDLGIEEPVFNVLTYGATGDGVTDDTDEIQAAIDAASAAGGGEVLVPAGIYIISFKNNTPTTGTITALVMRSKVTLHLLAGAELRLGPNQALTGDNSTAIIRNAGYFASAAPYDSDIKIIGDGVVNGNSANNASSGITNGINMGKVSRVSIEGIRVKNCRGTEPGPPGETIGVNFWRCLNVNVDRVNVFSDDGGDTASGIGTNQCLNVVVTNSDTYKMKWGVGNTHWDGTEVRVDNCHSYLNGGYGFLTEHSEGVTFNACVAGGKVTDYDMGATNTALSPIGELGVTTLGNGQNSASTNAGGFGIDSGTRITLRDCTSTYNGVTTAQAAAGVRIYGSTTLTKDILIDGCRIFGNKQGVVFNFGDGQAAAIARSRATRITPNTIIGPNKHIDGSQTNVELAYGVGTLATSSGLILGSLVTSLAPVAASGTAVQNPFPFDVTVLISGGVYTNVAITPGGPVPSAAYNLGRVTSAVVPHGASITLTYTTAPTWTWYVGTTIGGALVDSVNQTTQSGTAYTLALADAGALIETSNAAAVTVTVPPNSSVAFPVGSVIVVRQYGAGQVTFAAGAGVTLRSRGAALKLAGQYSEATLTKRATDEWVVSGDLVA